MELREKDTGKVLNGLKCCTGDVSMCRECYLRNERRCTLTLKKDAIEHIEEIEREVEYFGARQNTQPEWISVEDRLPEEDQEIFMSLAKEGNNFLALRGFYKDFEWCVYTGLNYYAKCDDKPSFWTPASALPDPPKPKAPTFKDVFLKKFPMADMECGSFHPCFVFPWITATLCNNKIIECSDCWNQPYFEEE